VSRDTQLDVALICFCGAMALFVVWLTCCEVI